jgi:ribonucleoside-diphosphate reductase alpha chain
VVSMMTPTDKVVPIADSFNIRVYINEGTMYVIIQDDEDGKPYRIDVSVGKAGSAVAAWAGATCDLIGTLWAYGVKTEDIITRLAGYTSDKYKTQEDGTKVYSGPQGVQVALLKYLQWKKNDVDKGNRSLRHTRNSKVPKG